VRLHQTHSNNHLPVYQDVVYSYTVFYIDDAYEYDQVPHNYDGPAVLFKGKWDARAIDLKQWFWMGRDCSFKKWLDLNDVLSEDEKVMMVLQYG
jgi:hypothetical protein